MKIDSMKNQWQQIVFFAVFVVAGMVASRINFSQALGQPNQFFTLFQFFAPIAGGFLGGLMGPAVVIATQLTDFLAFGRAFTLLNILRILPLAFAAWYFSTSPKHKSSLLVPLACIAAFVLNPVGQQVWYFAAFFWGIPVLVSLFLSQNLLARSLGATLTAHAIGGVVWIYALPTTAQYWNTLIPIVAYERTLFALGIAGSFILMNAVLSRVKLPSFVHVEHKLPLAG